MDLKQSGVLLRESRENLGITQKQLAEKLNISAKTVSKWECGNGFPDISILHDLAGVLGVSHESILSGKRCENRKETGNMRNIKFFVCPHCGSITTATGKAQISCCGKSLQELQAKPADEDHKLSSEIIEDDFYITFSHDMSKEHYFQFVAYVCPDRVLVIRLYPEQSAEVRFPKMHHGRIFFYCNTHGLFKQNI